MPTTSSWSATWASSPRSYESGTSIKGRSRICKMGMSRVRAVLYVCSWSALKANRACRELYERLLAKGKAKRVALIAVVNKLLRQAFAVATKQEFYLEKTNERHCFLTQFISIIGRDLFKISARSFSRL